MISFETRGTLTHIPRGSQFTTEFMRADIEERLAEGKKVYTDSGGWEEPRRYGGSEPSRYTRLRVQTDGDKSQRPDFFIHEEKVGKLTFERLLVLEAGARLWLRGYVHHHNSFFEVVTTRARVLS